MNLSRIVSPVMLSNLFTMGVTSRKDPRQTVARSPSIPDLETRLLRAQLIMEEALETVAALGFKITVPVGNGDAALLEGHNVAETWTFHACLEPNLLEIADGCADTIYVCTGTLAACGIPDVPLLEEVCRENTDKFPDGEATTNSAGKFQKPIGHKKADIRRVVTEAVMIDMRPISDFLVRYTPKNKRQEV